MTVAAVTSKEPVLLGSAMLAAVASGHYGDLGQAMREMSEIGEICEPDVRMRKWHDARFEIFEKLQKLDRDIRAAAGALPII